MKTPDCEPRFLTKIAAEYIRRHREQGFDQAKEYLNRTCGGRGPVRTAVIEEIGRLTKGESNDGKE